MRGKIRGEERKGTGGRRIGCRRVEEEHARKVRERRGRGKTKGEERKGRGEGNRV